jgi:putative CocE/NonD family hydrolase
MGALRYPSVTAIRGRRNALVAENEVVVLHIVRRPVAFTLGLLVFSAMLATVPQVIAPEPALAAPNTFVTVAAGTPEEASIALNVRLPANYVEGQRYPTIFEISGYDGGSAEGGTLAKDFMIPEEIPEVPREDSRQLTDPFNGDYVTIHASVRGTGCSSGAFELFGWRAALDGKEIIDSWIVNQPWSNGDVGIVGHSYGGITGFMVAATQPEHLRGVSVSGLIDDMYRGIVYPGGVSNYGFPLLWTLGIRPAYDVAGGLLPGLVREEEADDDPQRQEMCANNEVMKNRVGMTDAVREGLSDMDNAWYQSHSLITYASKIKVPIHIVGAYQDEQTGPRGPTHLFEAVNNVPKRLIITNGDHNTETVAAWGADVIEQDRVAWLDHWIRGIDKGFGKVKKSLRGPNFPKSVTTFFEMHRDGSGNLVPNGRKDSANFPLPDTTWSNWYLHGDGTLSTAAASAGEAPRAYVSGTKRQFWNYQAGGDFGPPITTAEGPDELTWRSEPVTTNTAVVGPITATVLAQTTGTDTEFFVELVDEAPDGSITYLQRGLLRASHRAVDASRSDSVNGHIYRPYHPHTTREQITPLATTEYLIEVFPVGHVFRPGHRIAVKIHAPPFVDSYYVYLPRTAPGVNTIMPGSYITLPMVPLDGVTLGPELACGQQEAVRCVADPGEPVPVPVPVPTIPTLPPATLPPTDEIIPGVSLPTG